MPPTSPKGQRPLAQRQGIRQDHGRPGKQPSSPHPRHSPAGDKGRARRRRGAQKTPGLKDEDGEQTLTGNAPYSFPQSGRSAEVARR